MSTLPHARPFRLTQSAIAVVLVVVLLVAYAYRHRAPAAMGALPPAQVAGENYFSPENNLEQVDAARINQARTSIDVAMYAFTDKYLAEALVAAARRGVAIRIYRDRQQFDDEQRNARQHLTPSTTEMVRAEPKVEVRVKGKGDLMHLKAYLIDGVLLRDGSANWSPGGLKRQDNNIRFTTDASQVKAFRQTFEDMWLRDGNQEIEYQPPR